MKSNAHGHNAPIDEAIQAVASLHARCGHGEFIVGAVYGNEAFAKCHKCGILYCSVAVMKEINAAVRRRNLLKTEQ